MATREVGRLRAKQVVNAKPPKGEDRALIPDGGNLFLQLTKNKDGGIRRSWTFKYQLDRQRHELGLGPLHTVSLAEARDKARALRQQLLAGVDPLVEKRKVTQTRIAERGKAVTFEYCAAAYLKAHGDSWKNVKHRAQWQSTLETYVYPKIGGMAVANVDVDDVIRCVEPIWKAKPETASRVRGRIESILGFATVRKFRHGDNPARWRGHLAELLPAKAKVRAVEHHPALPYAELPAFMAELRTRDSLSARALEFTILCAARTGETIGADWDEIDLKNKVWAIGASRMKAGKEHLVPLSDPAVAILDSLKYRHGRVFPLSNMAMLELVRGMKPGCTVHGFRSAFMDWAHERTNFPKVVVDKALAHVVDDKTEAAYRRGDLLEKRRRLAAEWARYCAKPPIETTDKVVPMRTVVAHA